MVKKFIKRLFNQELVRWYRSHSRDLPWRNTNDPYLIWVSEIMLQQTQVDTVIPYFVKWVKTFPTVQSLADAEEDRVLSLWEGLGYYNRARNLHKAAKTIKEMYQGQLPNEPDSLQSLPGIGPYTAGAIASIAFGMDKPVVDGNIRRIFSRIFNITTPIQAKETEQTLWQIAQDLLPSRNTGEYNQALMELGALVCRPNNPRCQICPLVNGCLAYQLGVQEDRPVRKETRPLPHLIVTAGVIQEDRAVFLAKRPPGGLLSGMWEYPGGTQQDQESLQETLIREIMEELNLDIKVGDKFGIYKHAYTHFKVTLHAFRCTLLSRDLKLSYHTDYAWVPVQSLTEYPMGKIDRQISKELLDVNLP